MMTYKIIDAVHSISVFTPETDEERETAVLVDHNKMLYMINGEYEHLHLLVDMVTSYMDADEKTRFKAWQRYTLPDLFESALQLVRNFEKMKAA